MTKANLNKRILIVGFGYIGEQLARRLTSQSSIRPELTCLIRHPDRSNAVESIGAKSTIGDLAQVESLLPIGQTSFDTVFHFAPPPNSGFVDLHTRNLIAALSANPPTRLIYISTTGVYGDCEGNFIDETQVLNPQTDRARRRVDAESALLAWCLAQNVTLIILRAPGIYALDRLPIARLTASTPAIFSSEDSFTNHIHADDLTTVCIAAMTLTHQHIINVVDDSQIKMGDYFDLVADFFAMPRPPRISRAEAEQKIHASMLSFMRESRRIRNDKMKDVLMSAGMQLRFPTVSAFLQSLDKPPVYSDA